MVSPLAKIILTAMKQNLSQVGFRLRALRRSRRWTQETLSAACHARGFAVTRAKLAKYEVGITDVPARLIPAFAQMLRVDITELLPPLDMEVKAQPRPKTMQGRNLTGWRIRFFRKKWGWTQQRLADRLEGMGLPITSNIITNIENRRTAVTDRQVVCFAAALWVPVHSLFPNNRESASFADATHRNLQTGRQQPIRRKLKTHIKSLRWRGRRNQKICETARPHH
jgi:transcriptional regulator with XRE-family HTH domain